MEKPLQAQRPAQVHSIQPPRKVAVVLNGNARAVTNTMIQLVRQQLGDETLFVSEDLEQWRFIARRIVHEGFDTVLCGGGDGTFASCVSDILALDPVRPPVFGVLRLGTGNALATTMGASQPDAHGLRRDLERAKLAGARRPLSLLQVEGKLAPFAGVGYDSLILEDYNLVKGRLSGTPLEGLAQGGAGYAMAVAGRSIWRSLREPKPEVVLRNEGAPAQKVDLKGRPVGRPIARGEVLYKGPVTMAAASTVPYYGMGLKMFPQAMTRRDRFQLRVANVGALPVLANLPALFRGEYDHPDVSDFLCTSVSFHMARPTALQIGGDEVGRRERVSVHLAQVEAIWGEDAAADTRSSNREAARVVSLRGQDDPGEGDQDLYSSPTSTSTIPSSSSISCSMKRP